MHKTQVIHGEPIEALLPALRAIAGSLKPGPDGMFHCSVVLERERFDPLHRALMRAEAALLRQDADNLGTDHEQQRTPEQRSADAFTLVVKRLKRAAELLDA